MQKFSVTIPPVLSNFNQVSYETMLCAFVSKQSANFNDIWKKGRNFEGFLRFRKS